MKRNKKEEASARQPGKNREQGKERREKMPPWKKGLFYFILIVVVPVVFLLALEFILHVVGIGYNPDFFMKNKIKGETVYTDNFRFTYTYFPATLASFPNQFVLPLRKAPGTVRIFILGESAAMGDPEIFFSFSRILEVMLSQVYPGRDFEVVNTGITAINSHAILPIAKACGRLEPDFFVIYMGNNEVVGPFGPATTFLPFQSNLSYIRFMLFLRRTRIGQLVYAIKQKLGGGKDLPRVWGGMEMFMQNEVAASDERMQGVYANFAGNLRDMCRSASHAGARVILSTVSSNLKDCAPFRSGHKKGLPESDKARWQELFDQGSRLQGERRFREALDQYVPALALDASHAELHYRAAECCLALVETEQAHAHFTQARDLDLLRFRADSEINSIIRETAARSPGSLLLVDAEQILQEQCKDAIPGSEIFLDHVHFKFHGNYLLAEIVCEKIAALLGPGKGQLPSEMYCAYRLAYSRWEGYNILETVVQINRSPPFTYQYNNEHVLNLEQARLARLKTIMTPETLKADDEIYRRAIQIAPDDWMLRQNYGRFLFSVSEDGSAAVPQFQSVLDDLPYNFQPYFFMGLLMQKQGKYQEAVDYFKKCLDIHPDYVEAQRALGDLYYRLGDFRLALRHYKKAFVPEEKLAEVRAMIRD